MICPKMAEIYFREIGIWTSPNEILEDARAGSVRAKAALEDIRCLRDACGWWNPITESCGVAGREIK